MSDGSDPIGELEARIAEIDALADPAVQATVREIVRGLLALHRKGLVNVLQLLRKGGEVGEALHEELARDPLVSSLLILHDLHPDDLETRARAAAERLRDAYPDLELLNAGSGVVRASIGGRGGGASASARVIEASFLEAVPDARAVVIDVRKEPELLQLRRKAEAP